MNANAQRQARWRHRQKACAEELAQAKARIAELESELKKAQDTADPDSELGKLMLRNIKLQVKLIAMERLYKLKEREFNEAMRRNGKMDKNTQRAIVKCLHPDRTPSTKEREHACKLFNDFRS